MPKGKIKMIGTGFGFILMEDGKDLHFNAKCLKDTKIQELQKDDSVEYEKGTPTKMGDTAAWVKKIGGTAMAYYLFRNPYNFVRFLEVGNDTSENGVQLGRTASPLLDAFAGLSGTISCTYKCETPLFIAGEVHERKDDKHKILDFFKVGDQPVIPASSLRGMIRSVFETITNSCMINMQLDGEDRLEFRRSSDPGLYPARITSLNADGSGKLEKFDCTNLPEEMADLPGDKPTLRCGLIPAYKPKVKRNWSDGTSEIYSQCLIPDCAKDGQRVAAIVSTNVESHLRDGEVTYYYFRVKKIEELAKADSLVAGPDERRVFGYLKITGPNIENKHDERLFFNWDDSAVAPPETTPDEFGSDAVSVYNRSLGHYWERHAETIKNLDKASSEEELREGPSTMKWHGRIANADTLPLPSDFISAKAQLAVSDLVYCSGHTPSERRLFPVAMPRQPYRKPREDLLPEHLKPCSQADKLCPACRLFGWVAEKRTTDDSARAGRVQFFDGRFDDANPWRAGGDFKLAILGSPKPTATYMYLVDSKGEPDFFVNYDAKGAKLRGRKYYWHHAMKAFSINPKTGKLEWQRVFTSPATGQDKSNVTLKQVIDVNKQFSFSLRFENLYPVELGALLWALKLEPGWHHRLGLAKPLGFGSLSLAGMKVYEINRKNRYANLLDLGKTETADWQEKYVNLFKQAIKDRFGPDFDKLDNYQDLQMMLMNGAAIPIHYPRPKIHPLEKGEQFKWFVGNKRRQHTPLPLVKNDKGFHIWNERGIIQTD